MQIFCDFSVRLQAETAKLLDHLLRRVLMHSNQDEYFLHEILI